MANHFIQFKELTYTTQEMVNKGVKLAEQTHGKGTQLAAFLHELMKGSQWETINAIFRASLEKHGIRSADNGNISTPTDTLRTYIDSVSTAFVGKDGYPFDGALGVKRIDGEYQIYDKGVNSGQRTPKVDWGRMAKKFKTDAQKRKALESFAKALGLEI